MIIVPVHVIREEDEGLWCRMGSEPAKDSPEEWVPKECISVRSSEPTGTMSVLVLDEAKLPRRIRDVLGVN